MEKIDEIKTLLRKIWPTIPDCPEKEELAQLLASPSAGAPGGKDKPVICRFRVQVGTESGNRRGWVKRVTAIDPSKKNGFAFEGDFLPGGKVVDLLAGSVLVCCDPAGSVAHPRKTAKVRIVTKDKGKFEDSTQCVLSVGDWHKDFLTIKTCVEKYLKGVE